jgi:aminopeptidase N
MKKLLFPAFLCIASVITAQQNDNVPDCQRMHQQMMNARVASNNPHTQASEQRSDTIDLLKITINLNITDFTTDTIRGSAIVRFAPKMNNVSVIDLDLLHMTIDSVTENNSLLTFTYTDTLLKVNLPFVHNTTDTNDLIVYYHGKPQMDPSGWGGFYFQSGYAFSLGVGFQVDPHVFGRAWFPCFDNFVERNTYEFNIGTDTTKKAYCNGLLARDTIVNLVRWRKWVLNKTIPSYLACVSLAPYTQVNWQFNAINGPIPVILTAVPSDTNNMKASFQNLDTAFSTFEYRYGPYMWDRVGYCLVPFNSGAMEHASNISYPRLAANGSLTYEADIMAHELSHHWWGDLATCHNEGEMWLNEGWATYSQYIFTESVYGYNQYISGIRANHDDMVHYVHFREGGFLTMDSIPHQYTYGDHVYKKGADMAHTLRGYLGDSLFFLGIKYHYQQRQYTDVTSLDLRDDLIAATGQTSVLTSFFNDWILHPGWPHFEVDSFTSVPNGNNFDVTIYVKQKLRGAPNYYNNVPLEVDFKDAAWNTQTKKIIFSGQSGSFTFTLPIDPKFVGLDMKDKISDAITSDTKVIKTTGNSFAFLSNGRMLVNTQNVPDSAYLHIEHHWVKPDPFKSWGNPYRLTDHYWTVGGLIPSTYYAKATITYDGRTTITGGGAGHMDESIITANNLEDSVVLMYRKDAGDDWHLYPYFTKNMGSMTDKQGQIIIDSLRGGQYTIGLKDHTAGLNELNANNSLVKIYPNPSSSEFNVDLSALNSNGISVEIFDLQGKSVFTQYNVNAKLLRIDDSKWKQGIYLVNIRSGNKMIESKRVSVAR